MPGGSETRVARPLSQMGWCRLSFPVGKSRRRGIAATTHGSAKPTAPCEATPPPRGRGLAGPCWEIYGHALPDPAAAETEVFWLLR